MHRCKVAMKGSVALDCCLGSRRAVGNIVYSPVYGSRHIRASRVPVRTCMHGRDQTHGKVVVVYDAGLRSGMYAKPKKAD